MTIRALNTLHLTPDLGFFSGPGVVSGTVKVLALPENMPVFRRLRLHEQKSGKLVREVWSDALTGAYSFTGLRMTVYYVTGFDHTGTYGGVIETDLVPEVPA